VERVSLEIDWDEYVRVAYRKRKGPDPFALPGLGGRVINLEYP
jgi:hypothetical protein